MDVEVAKRTVVELEREAHKVKTSLLLFLFFASPFTVMFLL